MKRIKEDLYKIKPWFIIVTYAFILAMIVLHFNAMIKIINDMLIHLNPLFYGLIIAFILNIPMTNIEKFIENHSKTNSVINKIKRPFSIIISLLIALLIIFLVLWIVIPELSDSINKLITNLSIYFNSMIMNIDELLSYLHLDIKNLDTINLESIMNQVGLDYSSILQTVSNLVIGGGSNAIGQISSFGSFLFELFMGLMISLYLLGSKEMFIIQFKNVINAIFPKSIAKKTLRIVKISNDIFKTFVGGKLLEMAIVGLMIYGLMFIFKIHFAVLIASLCALLTIIPIFGSLVATIIACILLLSVNPIQSVFFFVLYQIVQNLDGNLIYPKIIGKSLGLPPVWILVSIFFFGGIFGAVGMLIAVPLTACIYTFSSEFIHNRLNKKLLDFE